MNKILVPLNNRENIDSFIKAGADEFYMGFFDENWTNACGEYSEINRMSGFKNFANRYQFEEILDVVKCVKDKQKDAFVTINSATYSQQEMELLIQIFQVLKLKMQPALVQMFHCAVENCALSVSKSCSQQ